MEAITGGIAMSAAGSMRAVLCRALIVPVLRGRLAHADPDALFTPEDHYRIKSAGDVQLSPDGSRLAFVESSIDRQAHKTITRVWLMTIATAALTPLTPEGGSDTSPR